MKVHHKSNASRNGDEIVIATHLDIFGGEDFTVITEHKKIEGKTETTRRFVGLPSNVDVTCHSLVLWDNKVVTVDVFKVFYNGEIVPVTITHNFN